MYRLSQVGAKSLLIIFIERKLGSFPRLKVFIILLNDLPVISVDNLIRTLWRILIIFIKLKKIFENLVVELTRSMRGC